MMSPRLPRVLFLLAAAAAVAGCSNVAQPQSTSSDVMRANFPDREAGGNVSAAAALGAGGRPRAPEPQFIFIVRRAASTPAAAMTATVSDRSTALTLTAHSLTADVRGFLATVTLDETFRADQTALDTAYTLPLDPDTLVEDAIIKTPGHELRLVVRKRDEAQAAYDAARRAGLHATLLDQTDGDRLTLHIGRLDAGQSLTATITCGQILSWNGHAFVFQTRMPAGPNMSGAVHINKPATTSTDGGSTADRQPPGDPAQPRLVLYHAHIGTEEFAALIALPAADGSAGDLHLEATGFTPPPPSYLRLTDLPLIVVCKLNPPLHAAATLNGIALQTLDGGNVDPRTLAAFWARAQSAIDPSQATDLGLRYGIVTPTTSLLGVSILTAATQP